MDEAMMKELGSTLYGAVLVYQKKKGLTDNETKKLIEQMDGVMQWWSWCLEDHNHPSADELKDATEVMLCAFQDRMDKYKGLTRGK